VSPSVPLPLLGSQSPSARSILPGPHPTSLSKWISRPVDCTLTCILPPFFVLRPQCPLPSFPPPEIYFETFLPPASPCRRHWSPPRHLFTVTRPLSHQVLPPYCSSPLISLLDSQSASTSLCFFGQPPFQLRPQPLGPLVPPSRPTFYRRWNDQVTRTTPALSSRLSLLSAWTPVPMSSSEHQPHTRPLDFSNASGPSAP